MDNFSISIIQIPTVWENPIQNQHNIEQIVFQKDFPISDLIVLPEMWSTGFSMNTDLLAESMTGSSIQWMLNMASQKNSALTGSLIIREKDQCYNRLIFAKPDGTIDYYDKRHCFGLAHEDKYFTPGNEKKIFDWRTWKICPMICYDLRFPAWSRNSEDYDLLLYVAQFPEKRRLAWSNLLIARAIENVCYVAGANGIGTDGNGIQYSGDSVILDYEGVTLAQFGSQIGFFNAILNKNKLFAFRRAYPFLKDQDKICIS
ncbi:MAG: nitrilase-related carbon-nitrogen hydrolase [Saprospiraceae bacterium]